MNTRISDVMKAQSADTIRAISIGAGVLVYVGMLVYSGVHNISLMSVGVAPEMMIWAMVGVVALELSAAALPLALHFWTFASDHKMAAQTFYVIDLAVIFLNVIMDFNHVSGADLSMGWARAWMTYGVPSTPIIAGVGWAILFQLDPSAKRRATNETLKASTITILNERIAAAASEANIDDAVTAAALLEAADIVAKLLGVPVAALPPTASSQRPGDGTASSRDAAPDQLPVATSTFASSSEPLPVAAAAPLPVATVVPPRNRKRPAQTASSARTSENPTKASSRR